MNRRAPFLIFLCIFIALTGIHQGAAQRAAEFSVQIHRAGLELGIRLYRAGKWTEAAAELRRSCMEASNTGQLAESLYWVSLAEFSLGEYPAALRDINELQRIAPAGLRIDNILYYKGRTLYYLGRHAEALSLFRLYTDILDRSGSNAPGIQAQKSVLVYWTGECLFSLGQQDSAAEQFNRVLDARPRSEKYEAASYRLAIIRQNKIQGQILDMLDWSYDEYLRVVAEYQAREKAYDETISAYRKQADGMPLDTSGNTELEAEVARYQKLLAEAEARIYTLEAGLSEAKKGVVSPDLDDDLRRIRELKSASERLRNEISPR